MGEDSLVSGPWTGFYNYKPKDKRRMDLHLEFSHGKMTGSGSDDVGGFIIRGRYDSASRQCCWTKTYPASHDVFYEGYAEGKGIWGRWEIPFDSHGGFHIWPKSVGEAEQVRRSESLETPADKVFSSSPN